MDPSANHSSPTSPGVGNGSVLASCLIWRSLAILPNPIRWLLGEKPDWQPVTPTIKAMANQKIKQCRSVLEEDMQCVGLGGAIRGKSDSYENLRHPVPFGKVARKPPCSTGRPPPLRSILGQEIPRGGGQWRIRTGNKKPMPERCLMVAWMRGQDGWGEDAFGVIPSSSTAG